MDDRAEALLSIDALCVDVPGRRLVDRLDARFAPGEFVAVLGPNGTGKTMTMLTLAGLRPATDGRVRLDGQDIAAMRRRDVARRLRVGGEQARALADLEHHERLAQLDERHRASEPTGVDHGLDGWRCGHGAWLCAE
jgi:ABC-type multidrug transport system ATPase subunit